MQCGASEAEPRLMSRLIMCANEQTLPGEAWGIGPSALLFMPELASGMTAHGLDRRCPHWERDLS